MSVATNRYCKEHPDLVELCTNCAHAECPNGKCKQYRQMFNRIRNAEKQELERAKAAAGTPEVLLKITAAINIIDELLADKDCESVYSPTKLLRIRNDLDKARNAAFGSLIDWKYIAKRMDNK